MGAPEFIYLNEQAVRISSWVHDETTGTVEFVIIAKGERDRDQMLDILEGKPVMLRMGNSSAIPMDVRSLDTRSTGEGPRSIHRLQVALWPEGSKATAAEPEASSPPTPEQNRLDRIIELLTEIRDEIRMLNG